MLIPTVGIKKEIRNVLAIDLIIFLGCVQGRIREHAVILFKQKQDFFLINWNKVNMVSEGMYRSP